MMGMRIGFFLAAMLLVWFVLTRTDDLRAAGPASQDTVLVSTAGVAAP